MDSHKNIALLKLASLSDPHERILSVSAKIEIVTEKPGFVPKERFVFVFHK